MKSQKCTQIDSEQRQVNILENSMRREKQEWKKN